MLYNISDNVIGITYIYIEVEMIMLLNAEKCLSYFSPLGGIQSLISIEFGRQVALTNPSKGCQSVDGNFPSNICTH